MECCGNEKTRSKVAIVGAGNVGGAAAYAMMMDGAVCEIALVDKMRDRAEGVALDLRHGVQFTSVSKIISSDSYEIVKGAQVVVITAGAAQKPGESRRDLVEVNTKIFAEVIPAITAYNDNCVLLVVTNPLDVMTYVAWKLSSFSSSKVIGTGTVLDTARLRYLMGKEAHVSPKDICAYILGEHGDSSFAWWSKASVAGVSLDQFPQLSNNFISRVIEDVRGAASKVIEKKGATFYSIGLVVAKIVRAILLNQPRVFSVSTILSDYLGINDVSLSVPSIIRSEGVDRVLGIELDVEEQKHLEASAEIVRDGIDVAMNALR